MKAGARSREKGDREKERRRIVEGSLKMSRAHRVWMTVACLLVLIFCLGAVGRCQDEEVIKRKSDEEDNSRRGSLMSAPKLDARSQHPETITEQLEQQSLAFSAKNQPMVSRKNNAPQNQGKLLKRHKQSRSSDQSSGA